MAKQQESKEPKITTNTVKIKATKDFKKIKKGTVYEVSPSDAEHLVEVKKVAELVK